MPTSDQFSKITKILNQKQADLFIPATTLITSSSKVSPGHSLPEVKIYTTESKCNISTDVVI